MNSERLPRQNQLIHSQFRTKVLKPSRNWLDALQHTVAACPAVLGWGSWLGVVASCHCPAVTSDRPMSIPGKVPMSKFTVQLLKLCVCQCLLVTHIWTAWASWSVFIHRTWGGTHCCWLRTRFQGLKPVVAAVCGWIQFVYLLRGLGQFLWALAFAVVVFACLFCLSVKQR